MRSIPPSKHSPVTDAPYFKYSGNRGLSLLYRIPGYGDSDFIEVIGDPDNGTYEWVFRGKSGKISAHSDAGYSCPLAALLDGLLDYDGYLPANGIKALENVVRGIVKAYERAELPTILQGRSDNAGAASDNQNAPLIETLVLARLAVAELNTRTHRS